MDAIWSFCGDTFFNHYLPRWYTRRHCWYAWILSLGTVSKFYTETTLYTDEKGADWLLNKLGLPFKNVVVNLDFLKDKNPQWWCYSKLKAYASHPKPFIHFDNDVFLWKKLPARLESASVIAQSPEHLAEYYPVDLMDNNAKKVGAWLPKEFNLYRAYPHQHAINCGIMGGNNLNFIHYYANLGMDFIEANQAMWLLYDELYKEAIVVEQYLLAACAYYYKYHDNIFGNINVDFLFKEYLYEIIYNEAIAKNAGYTHIIGSSKGDKDLSERLEKRVRREYPIYYENVLKYESFL